MTLFKDDDVTYRSGSGRIGRSEIVTDNYICILKGEFLEYVEFSKRTFSHQVKMFRSIVRSYSVLLRSSAASLHSQHASILVRGSSIRFISDSKHTQTASTGNTTTSSAKNSDTPRNHIGDIPIDLLYTMNDPKPVRHEILESTKPLTTNDLENWDIDINRHRDPVGWSDKIAFVTVKLLRKPTDWFFKTKYIHRAVMLETVSN